jgi:hypothetical protein
MTHKNEQIDINKLKKQNVSETLNFVTNLGISGNYNTKEKKNIIKLKKPLVSENYENKNSFSYKSPNTYPEIMQITLNSESPVTRKLKVKGNKTNQSNSQEEKVEFTLRPNFSLAGCQDLPMMKSDSYQLTTNPMERVDSFNAEKLCVKKNFLIVNNSELEDKYIQNTDEFRVNTEGQTGNMANLSKSGNDTSNLFVEENFQKPENFEKMKNAENDESMTPILTEVLSGETPNLVQNIEDRDLVITEVDEEEGQRILERLQEGMFEEDGNFIIDSAKLRRQNNTYQCKSIGQTVNNNKKIECDYISSVKEDNELNNISISVAGNMNVKTGKFSKYKNLYQKNDPKVQLDSMIANRLNHRQRKTSLSYYSKEKIKSSSNSKEKILNKYKKISHIGLTKSKTGTSHSQASLKQTGMTQTSPAVSHSSKMTSPKNERVNLNEKFLNSGNISKFNEEKNDRNKNQVLIRSKSNKIQNFKNTQTLGAPSVENISDKISRGSKSSTSKFSNGINKSKDLSAKDYSKYDVQKLSYEISKEFSMIKIPKEKKFQERMEFYTLKKQIKDKKLTELINHHKVKLPENEKQNVFNNLIDDCNRRHEAKKRIELFSQDEEIINTLTPNMTDLDNNLRGVSSESNHMTHSFKTFNNSFNRKVSPREWDSIYRERFEKKEKEKNDKLNLIRINNERLKLQQEEMLVKKIDQTVKRVPQEVIHDTVNRLYKDGRKNKSKYEEFNFTQTVRKNLEKSLENNFSPIKNEEESSNTNSLSLFPPERESITNLKDTKGLKKLDKNSSNKSKNNIGVKYLFDSSKSNVVENSKYQSSKSHKNIKQCSADIEKQVSEKEKEIKEFEKLREIEMFNSSKIREEYMSKIKSDLNYNYKPKQVDKNSNCISKKISFSNSNSKSLKEKSNSSKSLMKNKVKEAQNLMKIINNSESHIQNNEKDVSNCSQQILDENRIHQPTISIPKPQQKVMNTKNTKKNKFIYKEPAYMKILYGGIEDLASPRKVKEFYTSSNHLDLDQQNNLYNNFSSDQSQTCYNYNSQQSGAFTTTIQSAGHLLSTMNTGNLLSSPSSSGGNNINININAPINITSSAGSLNHQNLEHQTDPLSSNRYVPEYLRKKLVNSIIGGFSK